MATRRTRSHAVASLALATSVLPFMTFPAEIRNAIYELSIELRGIESYFERYYERAKDSVDITSVALPRRNMHCPTIFLLSKQTYCEAIGFLRAKSLVFVHGLLDIRSVTFVSCPLLFRRISSFTITTTGHNVMAPNLIKASWSGYMEMIGQLADILAQGHELKSFVLELVDPGLLSHTIICWTHPQSKCDFRDGLMQAIKRLENVRGIGRVAILGLRSSTALQLKRRMESRPKTFMDLPVRIRSKIYGSTLDWSDCTINITKHMGCRVKGFLPADCFPRSTPTVLLLSRQVTREALAVLESKPLYLTLPCPSHQRSMFEMPALTDLISPATLQRVAHIVLNLESWECAFKLGDLCAVLARGHSLKTFTFRFEDERKPHFLGSPSQVYPDITLHSLLSNLGHIRGVDKVTITGDLPSVYAKPLAMIMRSRPGATHLPHLLSVSGCGKTFSWAKTPT